MNYTLVSNSLISILISCYPKLLHIHEFALNSYIQLSTVHDLKSAHFYKFQFSSPCLLNWEITHDNQSAILYYYYMIDTI